MCRLKKCTKCLVEKNLEDFRKREASLDRHTSWCKRCEREGNKKRYIPKVKAVKEDKEIDKEAIALEAKKRMLLHRYSLEYEDYLKMYADQNGKCKICYIDKELGTKGGLYVDHNHTTGKVRGLLCSNCNTMLGKVKEDIDILKNTIKYIEDYK